MWLVELWVIALILAMGMCSVAMAGLQNNEVIEIAEWIKKQVPVEMPSLENRAGEKGDPSNLFELMAQIALVKQKEVSTSDNGHVLAPKIATSSHNLANVIDVQVVLAIDDISKIVARGFLVCSLAIECTNVPHCHSDEEFFEPFW
ncbi:uncharacterized protein [Battus philenor]|uniref:uncharacterized protein n=1 Tax=Battus philenor TaxID=42288 RepID=UPI0035CEF789